MSSWPVNHVCPCLCSCQEAGSERTELRKTRGFTLKLGMRFWKGWAPCFPAHANAESGSIVMGSYGGAKVHLSAARSSFLS